MSKPILAPSTRAVTTEKHNQLPQLVHRAQVRTLPPVALSSSTSTSVNDSDRRASASSDTVSSTSEHPASSVSKPSEVGHPLPAQPRPPSNTTATTPNINSVVQSSKSAVQNAPTANKLVYTRPVPPSDATLVPSSRKTTDYLKKGAKQQQQQKLLSSGKITNINAIKITHFMFVEESKGVEIYFLLGQYLRTLNLTLIFPTIVNSFLRLSDSLSLVSFKKY